jgi:hypothetical protein
MPVVRRKTGLRFLMYVLATLYSGTICKTSRITTLTVSFSFRCHKLRSRCSRECHGSRESLSHAKVYQLETSSLIWLMNSTSRYHELRLNIQNVDKMCMLRRCQRFSKDIGWIIPSQDVINSKDTVIDVVADEGIRRSKCFVQAYFVGPSVVESEPWFSEKIICVGIGSCSSS